MLTKHKPKGLTPADLLQKLPPCSTDTDKAGACNTHRLIGMALAFSTCCITPTQADTVYRCGEAYSTSSHCANGAATEVKPSAALHTTGPDTATAVTRDLRDAQALEKQRLQAEQQAAQTASIRLSTPSAPSANPAPGNIAHDELSADQGYRKGKHTRKAHTPYFTAVDPTATPKKKSTAKTVPVTPHP